VRSYIDSDEAKSFRANFLRRTDWMPKPPTETKHHPSSVNIELLKTMRDNTKATTLVQFLQKVCAALAHLHGRRTSDPTCPYVRFRFRLPSYRVLLRLTSPVGPGLSLQEFTCIGKEYANRLVGEMAQGLGYDTLIKEVSDKQVVRIHQLLREVHFDAADGDCLSPAGEYNLRLGIMKELRPNMVATYNAGVGVFEGNPFVVEAGVSLGGKDVPTVRASTYNVYSPDFMVSVHRADPRIADAWHAYVSRERRWWLSSCRSSPTSSTDAVA